MTDNVQYETYDSLIVNLDRIHNGGQTMQLAMAKTLQRTATHDHFRVIHEVRVNGEDVRNIVLASEAEAMKAACYTLHVDPGVNPHTNNKTAETSEILIEPLGEDVDIKKLRANGPYWWSTPDLQKNGDPKGAVIFDDN